METVYLPGSPNARTTAQSRLSEAAQCPLSIAEAIDAVTENRGLDIDSLMSHRVSLSTVFASSFLLICVSRTAVLLGIRSWTDICCPFVVLDHDQRTLAFAHASVAEYLKQLSKYGVSQINFLAVRRCLKISHWGGTGSGIDVGCSSLRSNPVYFSLTKSRPNISDESISQNGIIETELQNEKYPYLCNLLLGPPLLSRNPGDLEDRARTTLARVYLLR